MLRLGLVDERLGRLDARREPLEFPGDDLEAAADGGGECLVGVRDAAAQPWVDVRVERVTLGGHPLEATTLGLEVLGVATQRRELLAGSQEGEVGRFDLVPAPQRPTASTRCLRSPRLVSRICFAARFFRNPGIGNAGSISTV